MTNAQDFTPDGVKIEGSYENDRNAASSQLFKDIIREVFGVQDVIIAHHLVYVREDKRADGFMYQVVEEIPSADSLIFDHDVAKKLWGDDWQWIMRDLACEPVATRDILLGKPYYARTKKAAAAYTGGARGPKRLPP